MRVLPAFFLSLLAICNVAFAQEEASIIGQVKDESGAILPGVTVTATSPALQIGTIVLRVEPIGSRKLPNTNLMNLRFEKSLRGLAPGHKVAVHGVRAGVQLLAVRSGHWWHNRVEVPPDRRTQW